MTQARDIADSNFTSIGGIQLGGTGSANLLDDYEEGTWTPVFVGTTTNPTVSYNSQTEGCYTKIGQVVIVRGTCYASNVSGGSGSVGIGGLPFTVEVGTFSGRSGGFTVSQADNFTSNNYPTTAQGNILDTTVSLRQILTSSGTVTLTTGVLTNTSLVRFQYVYKTTL